MATKEEIEASLARARKVVAEGESLLEAVRLRRQETDRFLADHGLTREQLASMRFTDEQVALVNRELARAGYPPLDRAVAAADVSAARPPTGLADADAAADGDALENRQRKFGSMMQEFRL